MCVLKILSILKSYNLYHYLNMKTYIVILGKRKKKKRETLKVGYLSKSVYGVNFIINIIKRVFRKLN